MRIRPNYGLEPIYYYSLLGKKSPFDILPETPLSMRLLSKLKVKRKKYYDFKNLSRGRIKSFW